jgi:hypothetical protein
MEFGNMLIGTRRIRFAVGIALAGLAAAGFSTPGALADAGTAAAQASTEHHGSDGEVDVNVCTTPSRAAAAACHAHKRTDASAKSKHPSPNAGAQPNVVGNGGAYDPAFLQSAYNLNSAGGTGQTVAIVDAYNNPNAESDLAYYRSYFHLPACTTANGCFRKADQRGGTSYPANDYGWSQEISLDLDMVSAICPNCKILLVEADSNSFVDLGVSVNRAVAMGAMAVSNSYGGGEYNGESADGATYFNHPGVAITVSSGDSGYGVQFPAASRYVTAVGGTSLNQATSTGTRNATETVWSGAGSGCSAYETKPTWQTDTGCSRRTVADVSAVADPNTGVWVYDTYGDPGFEIFGGTSVAAPIVAAVYALAGTPGATDTAASYPYSHPSSLFDITSGSNGSCGGTYLCTGKVGYDGPTGLGTPNSTTAFTAGGTPPPPPPPPSGTLGLSGAQTLTAGQASAPMTVSVSPAPTGSSTVATTLSTSSAGGRFSSDGTTWSSGTSMPVTLGSSGSSTFYYRDTTAGAPAVTAAATGYTSATQSHTVKAGPLARLTLSPSNTSVRTGRSVRFTANGADAYGNAVPVSGVAWSVSPSNLGSFSSISGASATFTGQTTGSGTVSAKVGTITGTASVTVRRR